MTQTVDTPQSKETYLDYMIDKLGAPALTDFSDLQTSYVKDQKLVFLIREFIENTVIITRIFTEQADAESFKDSMTKILEDAVYPYETGHELAEIDYDEFAELESREGVKQYFWYNE